MNLPPYGSDLVSNGVILSTLLASPQVEPDMTLTVSEGGCWINGREYLEFAGGDSDAFTAPTTQAKWSLLVLHYAGYLHIINGAESLTPQLPILQRNTFPLAAVYLEPGDTIITEEKVFDLRPVFASNMFSHKDVEDRDDLDEHPISSITDLQAELTARPTAVDVDTLLDAKADTDGTIEEYFVLNKDLTGSPLTNVGIMIERGSEANVQIRFNETINKWEYTNDGTSYESLSNDPDKANKVSGPVVGNFAGLDAAGDLTDSGLKASDFEVANAVSTHESSYDHTEKADKVSGATAGNIAELDAGGNLLDSGIAVDEKADKIVPAAVGRLAGLDATGNLTDSGIVPGDKSDKVSGATNGNLAGLDGSGNLTDSGSAPADFEGAGTASGLLSTHESSFDHTGKADKIVPAAVGRIATLDAAGNLTDSGVMPGDKADKIVPATTGDFASLDASGNLSDSGVGPSDFESGGAVSIHESSFNHTGKADKIVPAAVGNLSGLDAGGNLTDSGSKPSDFEATGTAAGLLTTHESSYDHTGKADKVGAATAGNLAGLDGSGNLTDSGSKPSDFTAYTAAVGADWSGSPPATIAAALDRIAAAIGPIV